MVDHTPDSTITRRSFLLRAGGAAAAVTLPARLTDLTAAARASARANQPLIIALAVLPSGFDQEVNAVGPEAQHATNVFENPIRWPIVPAPQAGPPGHAFSIDVNHLHGGALESWRRDAKHPNVLYLTVRRGWKSNYGHELTAEDVKWTWERAYPLKGFSIFAFTEGGFGDPHTSSIDVVDKYTVKLTTNHPNLSTIPSLAGPFNYFQDSTEAKKHATAADPQASKWIQKNDASWGAYTVTEFHPGQEIHYIARDDYYEGRPAISKVIMRAVPDGATRAALLARGDVDVAMSLAPTEYKSLAKTAGVQVLNFIGNTWTFIHLNEKRPPLDNKLVRQALNYAVPHQQIGQAIYNGLGHQMKSPLASTYPAYTGKYGIYTYDLARAKTLLKQAGHASGFQLEMIFSPDAFPEHAAVASILQTSYRQIGINLVLTTVPGSSFFSTVYGGGRNKKFQAALDRESSYTPDPVDTMFQFFDSHSDIDTSNFQNARYDQVVGTALNTATRAKWLAAYHEAQRIAMEEAIWVYIWCPASQEALRSNLSGYAWQPWDGFHWPKLRRKS